MASFDPQDHGFDDPPPRPTTPPVRRGFLVVLSVLCLAAAAVYGVTYLAEQQVTPGRPDGPGPIRRLWRSSTKQGSSIARPPCFAWRRPPSLPAVVNVQSFRNRRGGEGFPGLPLGGNRMTPRFQSAELGSGVVIDKDKGYVVTNNHVVKDADRIMVRLGPGDEVPARLVGADPKSDLAVLQIKAELQVQAEWGDSDKLDIGDWVLAIGSPARLRPFGDRRHRLGDRAERPAGSPNTSRSSRPTRRSIPGNSGGPLINLAGKVVGINTAIITQSGGYEGIGLAIPSSSGSPRRREPDQGGQGRSRLSGRSI